MGAHPGTGDDLPSTPEGRWASLRRAGILLCLGVTSCGPSVLVPAGAIGKAERSILVDSLGIMLAIVLPTIALALAFAWWYRQSNGRAKRLPEFVYSGRIELVVWAVPLMTIMLLGGVTWIGAHALDPGHAIASKQKPLEIQGVSLDWKWLFIYPDQHVASVNELTVPTGVPIHFSLTSGSVMNAFFIPRLGSMIYTMDGMISRLNLMADKPGNYWGESSHYSGDGFSDMHFNVHAVPQDQFAAWVSATQASGPKLDAGAYTQLAKQSRHVAPFTYASTDPDLFLSVASERIPQGPGPVESGAKKATVSPEGLQ
jgi:cytochrome o ubiquinol oxidase subunit 2